MIEEIALGVDVGGTKLLGVAVDPQGTIVGEARVPTPSGTSGAGRPGADDVVDAVEELVAVLVDQVGLRHGGVRPRLGVGIPGMVDRTGTLRFAPNLPSANGSPFRTTLTERLSGVVHPEVAVHNDANLAVWAELQSGAAQGIEHVVMVTLGTGIGGGVVVDGHVQTGAHGFAAEIGHMVVDPSGPPCPCGGRGCWERFASGGGLGRLAREAALAGNLPSVVALAGGDPEDVRGEHVTAAALESDADALAVMKDLGWWVALGLANLAALLDPSIIVVGGGLAEAGDVLLGPTREAFAALVEGGASRPAVEIVPAAHGVRAGAIGAALVARTGGLPT